MATGNKYMFICSKRKELIGIIQRDPENVLDESLARSIITEEEYDSMNQLQDKEARIRKLLIYVQRRGESTCRDFLECLESLFPGTTQILQPSEYDFFNPERDSRPRRDPEPRTRDFFNREHNAELEEEHGFNPEQESDTQQDPVPEEKDDFSPVPNSELGEEDGSNPEKESDIQPETDGSDFEQESETQQDHEPKEEDGSNPEQESETEPDPEPEGSNSEQESESQ